MGNFFLMSMTYSKHGKHRIKVRKMQLDVDSEPTLKFAYVTCINT